jgi:hypothetical protein
MIFLLGWFERLPESDWFVQRGRHYASGGVAGQIAPPVAAPVRSTTGAVDESPS